MERRAFIRAAAWAVPTVALAVAVPAASASGPEPVKSDRIDFTNKTATVGKKKNTIYGNTKVKVLDGPGPVQNLLVAITVDGVVVYEKVFATVGGWDNTGIINFEYEVEPGLEPIEVEFYASALDVQYIHGTVTVARPGWWFQ